MSDLERLQILLRSHLAGRDLTQPETWRYLADHYCEGMRGDTHFMCRREGVTLRENGATRLIRWEHLAQRSIFDALEAL